jgi:hypothetical protein
MAGHQPPVSGPGRARQITAALRLAGISVVFGIGSGAVSVAIGLLGDPVESGDNVHLRVGVHAAGDGACLYHGHCHPFLRLRG